MTPSLLGVQANWEHGFHPPTSVDRHLTWHSPSTEVHSSPRRQFPCTDPGPGPRALQGAPLPSWVPGRQRKLFLSPRLKTEAPKWPPHVKGKHTAIWAAADTSRGHSWPGEPICDSQTQGTGEVQYRVS